MIGRRLIAASVVAGAVAVGAVAGAVIGIPGLSSASTSGSSGATGSSGASGASGSSGPSGPWGAFPGRHFRGFFGARIGADKDVLDAAAKALNLTTEQLLQKLSDGKTTIADVAQQQNVELQTVIDAMEAVAKQDIENFVNNPLPAAPKFPGGMPKMGPGGFGFVFGLPGVHDALDPIAKALGISTDELQNDLKNGQSIADIAKAQNVDLSKVVDAVMTEVQGRLDQMVKDNKLSQDQADRIEARLKERITDALNHGLPQGLGGFGFRFHGGRSHVGPDGAWPGPPPGQANTAAAITL